MSATTQITTFSDAYTDLLNRVRAQTGVTATENQAKRYINIALHDMHIGTSDNLPWAERHATLVTQPNYSTGTLSVSRGGTAVTGSGTLWATNNDFAVNNVREGGKMVIAGSSEVYEVSAVGSDTALTLASAYVGSADASGDTYLYFEDEYSLASDFLRPVDVQLFSEKMSIALIPRTDFRRRFPRNATPGTPRTATLVSNFRLSTNAGPERRVVLHQPPNGAYAIPYNYITKNLANATSGTPLENLSSDDDEPIVYLRYRHVIVLHALYHWYRDKRDDKRSAEARQEYVDTMIRMTNDNEIGSPRPRIQPNMSIYRRSAERPWSGRHGRRHTVGSAFDELRE